MAENSAGQSVIARAKAMRQSRPETELALQEFPLRSLSQLEKPLGLDRGLDRAR